jgi:hypothetical protein
MPKDNDQTVYFVVEEFGNGRARREADYEKH